MLYAFCAKIRMNFLITETLSDFMRTGVTAEVRILQDFKRKGTKIFFLIKQWKNQAGTMQNCSQVWDLMQ